MFLTGPELADSFYQGTALLIVPDSGEGNIWSIIKIFYINTADDKNINLMFEDTSVKLGSTIIQSTLVSGFSPYTKKVRRTFQLTTSTEHWEAI